MKQNQGNYTGRSLPKRRELMKNITELETRLRKYPTDKKRLEQERQYYDDARAMTPERYLQEVACRRTREHDPTGTLAVTYVNTTSSWPWISRRERKTISSLPPN
jgi:hypothetical protein